jgi:hypothetical protein
MTREPQTPEEPRSAADVGDEGAAAGADGLPLPPPDDAEKRLAEDAGQPEDAADAVVDAQQSRAAEISAERGAD